MSSLNKIMQDYKQNRMEHKVNVWK